MSAHSLLLWRLTGLPVPEGLTPEALNDPRDEVAVAAMPALIAAAERHLRGGGVLTGEEAAGLTTVERVALAAAAKRVEAARALLLAKAIRGGKGEAEIMATIDADEAEAMFLAAIPPKGASR